MQVIAEARGELGQVVRVLQVGVREGGDDAVVEVRERLRVVDLEAVLALEVDVTQPASTSASAGMAPVSSGGVTRTVAKLPARFFDDEILLG